MPWPSAPTASRRSPAAKTGRRGSGTRPPASPSAPPLRHQGGVRAVAFSPDGKIVAHRRRGQDGAALGRGHRPAHRTATAASGHGHGRGLQPRRQGRRSPASEDRTARLWDAATGTAHRAAPAAPGRGHGRGLQPRRQDPRSPASDDGTARLWDAATGRAHGRPCRTRARSSPWPSAPTARPSSPRATGTRHESGTYPRFPCRATRPGSPSGPRSCLSWRSTPSRPPPCSVLAIGSGAATSSPGATSPQPWPLVHQGRRSPCTRTPPRAARLPIQGSPPPRNPIARSPSDPGGLAAT